MVECAHAASLVFHPGYVTLFDDRRSTVIFVLRESSNFRSGVPRPPEREESTVSKQLFEPLTLRGVEIRNRVWVPPMCQYAVENRDGVATPWHAAHLGGLARGGAGAVIIEATGVVPEGRISPTDLGLWNDEQRDALVPIVQFMRSMGAVAGIQLAHAGRKASVFPEWGTAGQGSIPVEEGGWEAVAPSAIPFTGLAEPRALTPSEMDDIVRAFAAAARRAVDAGIELIEIHAAHGYLLHEFLSPLSNHREDEYGGSLENRARFLLRIVDAVRAEMGDGLALLVRLSATDWTEGGITLEDTIQVVDLLREHSVDLIDVSTGGNVLAQIPVGPGYQVRFASEIRRRTGVPTAAVGMITDPHQAEQILLSGQADVALIGREMLRDPNFAIRAALRLGHTDLPVPAPYLRAYARGRAN
ncbi:NADH:flavin oxidoreductase/NADH oxidase [Streptomyces olivaceus]|nr:NADH:flavin oxidoreductase/NADH oxidase [Streptomyces olivaceus]